MGVLQYPIPPDTDPPEHVRARATVANVLHADDDDDRDLLRRIRLRLQPRIIPTVADGRVLRVRTTSTSGRRTRRRSDGVPRRGAFFDVGVDNVGVHRNREGVVRDDETDSRIG